MIRIETKSREFSEVEEYLMTVSPAITSLKDVEDGVVIPVTGYLTFTDIKDGGDESEIFSLITESNEVYCCQSATFKRTFMDIAGIMKDKPFSIIKCSGVTKAGRDFIYCTLDISSVK